MRPCQVSSLDVRKAYRGLAWLAFANVVGAAILVAVSVVLRNEDSGRGVSDLLVRNIQTVRFAAISAQVLAWAIIFAFALRRRFVGLLLSAAFAIALGTINWVGFVLQDPTSASVAASSVWGNLLAFSIFAIAQGLRFLLGLRLVLQDELPASSAIRFGIGDLIEWMVSIGIFFGLGHLGGWFHNLMLLARHVAWWVLVSLPAALSIWSRRGPLWVSFLVTVSVPFVATATFEYSNGYFNSPAASRWRFIEHIAFLAASYIVATAANFVVVRRLGFRWTTPSRQTRSNQA
jgi:hypothetical protein